MGVPAMTKEAAAAPGVAVAYAETLGFIQQIERRIFECVAIELDRHDVGLEPTSALILYRIGADETTATELRKRGYYLGSNVSYNLKKLVEMGFLDYQRSTVDRRSVRVKATDKGREVGRLVAILFARQGRDVVALGDLDPVGLAALNTALRRLYGFLSEQIIYKQV